MDKENLLIVCLTIVGVFLISCLGIVHIMAPDEIIVRYEAEKARYEAEKSRYESRYEAKYNRLLLEDK